MILRMDEELEDIKKTLRALVVSTPTQMDVRTLLRDYRSMVGEPLPCRQWGYRDPLAFLRERCGDCFLFQGPLANPLLTLIVTQEIKHIDNMVRKQKISSTQKIKGKRRSVPAESQTKPPPNENLIVQTFKKPSTTKSTRDSMREIKNINNVIRYKENNISKNNLSDVRHKYENSIESNEKISVNTEVKEVPTEDNKISETIASDTKTAVYNFLKKRLPLDQSMLSLEISDNDSDSGRKSCSTSSAKMAQFEELKHEIKQIIVENPDGVWCTDVIRLYRERYNRELNFTRYGHTSIAHVCQLVEGVAVTATPDGDWLLRDAAAPPPPSPPALPRDTRPHWQPPPLPAASHYDPTDDALPGIDYDPEVFPVDCMQLSDSLPRGSLAALAPGAMLPVLVGEVYSPSHFWMLRLGEQHYSALEAVMEDMNVYYASEGAHRFLAPGAVRVGHYCSSLYEGDWHRSLIVDVLDSDAVKVRHVDYGTVERVRRGSLRPLLQRWAQPPTQAVRARLAGAGPPGGGGRGPRDAAAHFLRLVSDRRLVANVVAVDTQEEILEVFLVDTATEDDVLIHEELIRAGHADSRSDSALHTSESHLYPRFDALECGATPSYAEIHAYLRDGIALDYVDAYRRHVPPPPAEPPTPPVTPAHSALLWPPAADASSSSHLPSLPYALSPAPPHRPPGFFSPAVPPLHRQLQLNAGVMLSARECDTFCALSHVSPQLAYSYMLDSLAYKLPPGYVPAPAPGSLLAPTPGSGPAVAHSSRVTLNPNAAEFRMVTGTQTEVPVADLITFQEEA